MYLNITEKGSFLPSSSRYKMEPITMPMYGTKEEKKIPISTKWYCWEIHCTHRIYLWALIIISPSSTSLSQYFCPFHNMDILLIYKYTFKNIHFGQKMTVFRITTYPATHYSTHRHTHTHIPVPLSLRSSKQCHLVGNMNCGFLSGCCTQGDCIGVSSQSLIPSAHNKVAPKFGLSMFNTGHKKICHLNAILLQLSNTALNNLM